MLRVPSSLAQDPVRSTSPHLWLTQIFAVWLIAFVVMDGVVWRSGWFFRRFPEVAPDASHAEGRLAVARQFRPRIAVIGDSLVCRGFRPALFDQTILPPLPATTTCNLAVNGATFVSSLLFLRELLRRTPAAERPAVIVLGLTVHPFNMPVDPWHPTDLYPYLDWPGDAPPSELGWDTSLSLGVGAAWQFWRYRQLSHQVVAAKIRSLTERAAGATLPRRPAASPPPDALMATDEAQGYYFHPGTHPGPLNPRPWEWRQGAQYQEGYLRRMIRLSHDHHIPIVLVWMPEYRQQDEPGIRQSMLATLQASGADEVVDLSQAMSDDTRWWQDNLHVTPDGATAMTRRMAVRLGPVLQRYRRAATRPAQKLP